MSILLQKLLLKCLEVIYKCQSKDIMTLKLERYRLNGVDIPIGGGDIRCFSRINCAEPYLISIGQKTTISTNVQFCTHDNAIIKTDADGTDLVGYIKIGENCFIGMNTILMPGIRIANNCIVGAGSVVTKSVDEEGIVVAGNPARKICSVKEYKIKNQNNIFDFSGLNTNTRKQMILSNQEKWLRK